VEQAIVGWRKQLTEGGHDAGAQTIAWHLRQQTGWSPSPATIWRILSHGGFVTPQLHSASPVWAGGSPLDVVVTVAVLDHLALVSERSTVTPAYVSARP
jgi:hypothetical protein